MQRSSDTIKDWGRADIDRLVTEQASEGLRLEFKEGLMGHMLELFPFLAEVKVMRQWAGIADMTPDFSPVMGATPLENYFIDAGWGTWGFKATPVCGKRLAQTIANGKAPDLIQPFALDRFANFVQIGERGAASVGH